MFPLTKIGKKCHKVCHEFTIISVFHATAFVNTKINFIAVFLFTSRKYKFRAQLFFVCVSLFSESEQFEEISVTLFTK